MRFAGTGVVGGEAAGTLHETERFGGGRGVGGFLAAGCVGLWRGRGFAVCGTSGWLLNAARSRVHYMFKAVRRGCFRLRSGVLGLCGRLRCFQSSGGHGVG